MMIELIVCDYLTTKLSCPVAPEKPQRPFDKAVYIERTGGRGKFIYETTIAIQSYANSLYEAALLNDEVIKAMEGLMECDEVTKVSLNSNYNYSDTETKEYRYQAVFDIMHY